MFSSDMMLALRARWRLVALVAFLTIAVTAIWLASAQRLYIARASLLFDGGPNPSVQDNSQQQDNQSLLGTQADLIKSESVAARVVRVNHLTDDPRLRAAWRKAGGKGSFQAWLVQDLLAHVEVTPERDTNVLAVGFKSDDPAFAARMANSFAQQFVAARLQISTDAAKQYASWFQQRTTEVRRNLDAAQKKLGDFQRSHGMVNGNTLALEADRLSSLSTQLASAESSAADLRARAGTKVSRSPDVQSSAVVEGLRQQIAAADAKVSQLATTHGDNHPDLIAARAELQTLRNKLTTETAEASDAVRIASSAASTREAQLQGLVNSQRAKMLELTGYQSQFEALQNDVNTAQNAYDAVTQRLNLMRLQSGLPTTNVQQVDRATPPLLPSSPNVPLLGLLAVVAGLVLGVIAAMIAEWRAPRVRSAGGLFDSTGVPVLGNFTFSSFRPEPALALRGV
ncbi:MAG: GNVR domain-containing protein [Sphingomonas sp.]